MGSIRRRNDKDVLFLDFRYRGARCREQTVLPDTPDNRRKLEAVLAKLETEITFGTFDYGRYFPNSPLATRFAANLPSGQGQYPRFRDFVEIWFGRKEPEWRRTHITQMRFMLDHWILPAFGDRLINTITKIQILDFRARVMRHPGIRGNERLSAESVNHIMAPLRMVMRDASEQFGIPNPYTGIKAIRVPRSHVEPFALDEVRLILANVREDFRNYYTMRFFTGMRPAEIDGLKWKFVDFERRQILVRETWVKGRVEYTKTDGSQREIDMSGPVFEALQAQYKVTGQFEYVFVNGLGKPLDAKNVTNRVWYPLLRYLNLRPRVPYQTRHTAATLWLAAGESPEWIARQMGHTTTEMLFRVYSRFVPNLTRRDGSAFEKLLQAHHLSEPNESGANERDERFIKTA
ncbi:MAG TPA: site-specific integrase [Gammaproteobacteria bacterium]|nr:site-specific integrase [Gammaproteobacteria bacterium]